MSESKTSPLVSIWIPVFNGAELIGRAIESCLAQDYANLEIFVFDDQSTDNTEEVVQSYRAKDGRVRYFKSEKRLGFTRSLPTIFKNTSGEFVLFLAHDDWLSKNCVRECLDIIERDPNMGVVTGRNLSVVERNGTYTLEREADATSGIYTRDWFGKRAYQNFAHSMMFLGLMRRKDALRVALFMEHFAENPPAHLPEELKSLLKHEYVADILFPVRLMDPYRRFAISEKAAYLKTELPLEHYMARKGSMGLRAKYGIDNETAKGILKRYLYSRLTHETLFEDGWKEYISGMRIFFGKETLATIIAEGLKHRLRRDFFQNFGLADMGALFQGYSLYEKAASILLVPFRLLGRWSRWMKRAFVGEHLPDIYTENYFLDTEGHYTAGR